MIGRRESKAAQVTAWALAHDGRSIGIGAGYRSGYYFSGLGRRGAKLWNNSTLTMLLLLLLLLQKDKNEEATSSLRRRPLLLHRPLPSCTLACDCLLYPTLHADVAKEAAIEEKKSTIYKPS